MSKKDDLEELQTILRSCVYWEGVHRGDMSIDVGKLVEYQSREVFKYYSKRLFLKAK